MLLLMQQMDHSPHLQPLELQSPPTEITGQSPLDWLEEGGGPRDILPWGANGDMGFPWGSNLSLSLAAIALLM